jgi:hypothetical protein
MKKNKYNCSYYILSWYGYVIELKKKCEGVPWHPQVFFEIVIQLLFITLRR